ncbi:MAG TPA: DNA translocase FtsK 4TM domain-containing protein [Candidatus Saccharimonadales bacterium]|nr:DNA translocase FtsK 4TM domain-containing protein [Candidatus Saccharimonadales bacterium]
MAKKKKRAKKPVKKNTPDGSDNAFWQLSAAILMLVLAFFLLLGGFGTGGSLPVGMFKQVYAALGWVAYLTPFALVFFSVHKFNNEDRRIPLIKLASMLGFLVTFSVALHTFFADKDSFTGEITGGHGGYIGEVIGNAMLLALDKLPAGISMLIVATLFFFLAFNISLKKLLLLFKPFTPGNKSDTDLAELKARSEKGLKLNEGVPIEHSSGGDNDKSTRLSTLKNTAKKLAESENHEALTTSSDKDWKFPPLDLLNQKQDKADAGDVQTNADIIRDTLNNFNIKVEMEGANIGPRVTQYTLKPPPGTKLQKITALDNNLALDLAAHSIRIEAPIPGKRLVGIEVPNVKPSTVRLSSVLTSDKWQKEKGHISFVIGKDIVGTPIVGDLAKMPHLLIAGQTGSGKSVMINTVLTSMLYRYSPSDLKLIMVDPKQVELTPYNDIPHLLSPVIHEPEKCISALKWAVAEMERRLRTMAEAGKRNIVEYNNLKKEEGMPYVVIVIDELSDLMMMAARDVESLVARIAQKARAAGIHLILATQRPSVDVITGLIKANVPARVAFTTTSQVDSKTIIDGAGAEKLLGQGDMLLLTANMPKPRRVQAAFISDKETAKVTDYLREQRPPQYDDEVVSQPVQIGKGGVVSEFGAQDADDDLWRDAVQVVIEGRKASTSLLQRRLRVGYARAARLIETMEEQGIVSQADGSRPREVLVNSMDDVFGGGNMSGDVYDDMPDQPEDPLK